MSDTPADGKPEGSGRAGERLQKLLANAGEGSRRGLEQRIAEGAVRVNGQVAKLGDTATLGDEVRIGASQYRVVAKPAFARSIVYNKPLGEITTRNDPQGRPTVFDRLPTVKGGRWVAVGRLDINTTGLLLLTTDGELANAMMHPSNQVDREYACRVFGEVDDAMLARLKKGVELEDGPAHFGDIVDSGGDGENRWFHVTLMEGRNREVRRLWASQGVTVSRLKRVRYGAVFLPHRLRMGEWSELNPEDHRILREDVGLPGEPKGQLSLRPVKVARGRPARGKSGRGKPGRGKPGHGKPGRTRPAGGKSAKGKPPRGKSAGGTPTRGKAATGKPARGKPGGKPGGKSGGKPGGKPSGKPGGKRPGPGGRGKPPSSNKGRKPS